MCKSAKDYALLPPFLSFSRLTLPIVLVVRQSWISLLLRRSELIASVLLTVRLLSLDFHIVHLVIPAQAKDRCAALYDCIRTHIAGSKVIRLLYVHPI
jgi:hypothetical protein